MIHVNGDSREISYVVSMNLNAYTGGRPTVYVVDGDAAVRDSLRALLAGLGVDVQAYASAEAFLGTQPAAGPRCLIAEVHLPGMGGLELLERLRESSPPMPTILLASDSDVPLAVRAMRAGALDFLDKPFVERALLNRVRQALAGQV